MTLQRQAFRARLFRTAASVADRLAAWPNRVTPPPFRLMQIGSAFWQSRALAVAAELDIATVIGDARWPVLNLASRLGAHPDRLHRLLRFLSAIGVFALDAQQAEVRNNKLSQALRTDRPGGVRHVVLMHNSPQMSQPWDETLAHGVRTGEVPFERSHGQALFAHMDTHPGFDQLFAKAMDEVEALTGNTFVTAFDWGRFQRVIDLGGGKGAKTAAILRRHRHLQGLIVDRASVLAQARRWWQDASRADIAARVQMMQADLMSDALPIASGPGDVYLMSAVLHACDDTTGADLLRRVALASGSSGAAMVVMDLVMADKHPDATSTSFDMQMLMGTRGRERTMAEWQALFKAADLFLVERVELATFGSMLVLRRLSP